MHLPALNIPDLLIALWRATLECDVGDNRASWDWAVLRESKTWKYHGHLVAAARNYLPSSFGRPPRNPAEKINSGYKAWEFLIYIYGYYPALLYGILPDMYWRNFCKLVLGIRILHQRIILKAELRLAHKVLIEFCFEFEAGYYQRKPSRIHFVRPSIHQLSHCAPETQHIGPLGLSTQWPIERSIGDFGKQIRQPSNPFQNLAVRGIQRACINALHAIYPQFSDPSPPLRGSVDLGSGYTLLRKLDDTHRPVQCCTVGSCLSEGCCERRAFDIFRRDKLGMAEEDAAFGWSGEIKRWGRLAIPSGQIARSEWVEKQESRIARCTKILVTQKNGKQDNIFGEIRYFARLNSTSGPITVAMVYLFGPPDADILKKSFGVVCAMEYTGIAKVFEVTAISSVVALVP
ncbi:hypothetical protein K488DRAFT_32554, partial [Vararia minispora EC-137]